METPRSTPILHITHRDNLHSILGSGGFLSYSAMKANQYANIGNLDIKGRRCRRSVPITPYGVVSDYVPFYFAPRSPMLFAIHKGNVPGCVYGQTEIVYAHLVAEDVLSEQPCCFTDRNAVLQHAQFRSSPDDLKTDFIDWPLMGAIMWNNIPTDTERQERRMAEFLAHNFVPWKLVRRLVVSNRANLDYVQHMLEKHAQTTPVAIRPGWFF